MGCGVLVGVVDSAQKNPPMSAKTNVSHKDMLSSNQTNFRACAVHVRLSKKLRIEKVAQRSFTKLLIEGALLRSADHRRPKTDDQILLLR